MPLIVGMEKAAEVARKHLPDHGNKVRPLRDELEKKRAFINGLQSRS